MVEETRDDILERGRREGGIDAKLDEHARHLATVNGSIERSALALESVAKEVRDLRVSFDLQIKMAEAARIALAEETERRREALVTEGATTQWKFTRRQAVIGLLLTALAIAATIYFSLPHH